MQKMLEENILKVNYKSFTQIVILGSTNFVPFMQLSGSNRREVIEDLLDIRIFSAMNSLIKDKIRGQKDEIRTLDLSKDNIKDKVEMQTNFINELEGQFAIFIYDKSKNETLLFRDPYGIRPLFYHFNNKTFFFSSEIKSLMLAILSDLTKALILAFLLKKNISAFNSISAPNPWPRLAGLRLIETS